MAPAFINEEGTSRTLQLFSHALKDMYVALRYLCNPSIEKVEVGGHPGLHRKCGPAWAI